LSVSQETLLAANSVEREREREKKFKNASTGKPDWLVTYQNIVGSDSNLGNNNAAEEELKQGLTESAEKSGIPDWLITFRNTVGSN